MKSMALQCISLNGQGLLKYGLCLPCSNDDHVLVIIKECSHNNACDHDTPMGRGLKKFDSKNFFTIILGDLNQKLLYSVSYKVLTLPKSELVYRTVAQRPFKNKKI